MAAIGAAAAAGAAGFGALQDSFKEAREASKQLQASLDTLREAAGKLSEELPEGTEAFEARRRRLGGITGGLTSAFATFAGGTGEVSSDNLRNTSTALEELTLRFGSSERAAQALAIALRNPARAMQALREAGIQFTADQRRQLEGMQLFEDRLRGASKVLEIINSQLGPRERRSGVIELMAAIGKFAGTAPGAFSNFITETLKGIGSELARMSGLTYVLNELDIQLRSIGERLGRLNRRIFPSDEADHIANIREQLAAVNQEIARLPTGGPATGAGSILGRIFGVGGAETDALRRTVLERTRAGLLRQQEFIDWEQMNRIVGEHDARQRQLNERIQDRIQARREELGLMQAQNRAQLAAARVAAELGLPRTDPRVQQLAQLEQQIENRRRAMAQAGQLTVFERENQRLQHQVQLFRFGNEEMEVRNRLLQIELQAAQRRQPLDEAQKNTLLERLNLLRQVQQLTATVNQAAEAVFNSMADAIAQFATTGKFKFKEFADSVIQQLIRIALQSFVVRPLLNMISGFANPLIAGALSPGSTTGPITIPRAGGFAHGGSFTVPGGGSGGDKPYLIGLSAGERVDVTPQGRNGRGGGGVTVNNIINSSRDMEVTTSERQGPDGRTIIDQTFNEVVKRIGRGDADNTFGARYGMRPRTLQR
jgi:multidrug efflux pump subunit AcrA (membrane-fusion protein)